MLLLSGQSARRPHNQHTWQAVAAQPTASWAQRRPPPHRMGSLNPSKGKDAPSIRGFGNGCQNLVCLVGPPPLTWRWDAGGWISSVEGRARASRQHNLRPPARIPAEAQICCYGQFSRGNEGFAEQELASRSCISAPELISTARGGGSSGRVPQPAGAAGTHCPAALGAAVVLCRLQLSPHI